MQESVLGLAALLRALKVEAVDTEVSLSQGLTLEAGGPVRISLTRRVLPERRVQFREADAGDGAAAGTSATQ